MNNDWLEKDFYKTLGVEKSASAAQIKKSYRKLARELHPDHNPGDAKAEARFKEVSEAYDVLSDEGQRKEYDEARELFASGAFRGGYAGSASGGNFGGPNFTGGTTFDMSDFFGGSGGSSDVNDLFGNLFGGGGGRGGGGGGRTRGRSANAGPSRGGDAQARIKLGFEESIRGTTLPLNLTGPGPCQACRGSGAKAGTSPRTCATCGGSGTVAVNQGSFAFSEPCSTCVGTGRVIDDPCPQCRGTGATNQTRTITVRVPPGIKDGAKLRIAGKGSPGRNGGPAGDLFVTVDVQPHPLFTRKGDDLSITVPVSYAEAALGTTFRVPTLDSSVALKLAPGTSSGQTLRVRGRGVATKSGAGDLLVTVEVSVPSHLTPAQQEALAAFAASGSTDPRPQITAALANRSTASGGDDQHG